MAVQTNAGYRGPLMYETYCGLREKPFSILPDPDLIYWGQTHRMAFGMLEFGVMNNAGFTVITGEIGAGKTTLVRHLLRKLDPKEINYGLMCDAPPHKEQDSNSKTGGLPRGVARVNHARKKLANIVAQPSHGAPRVLTPNSSM